MLNVDRFVLKVLDPTDVDEEIWNLDGSPLNVPKGRYLCRRALLYQSLCAYVTAKRRNPNLDIQEPNDFSPEFEGQQSVLDKFLGTLQTSMCEETRELEEFEDDVDSGDGDGSLNQEDISYYTG